MLKGLAVAIYTARVPNRLRQQGQYVQVISLTRQCPFHRLLSYINSASPLEEEEEVETWLYRQEQGRNTSTWLSTRDYSGTVYAKPLHPRSGAAEALKVYKQGGNGE